MAEVFSDCRDPDRTDTVLQLANTLLREGTPYTSSVVIVTYPCSTGSGTHVASAAVSRGRGPELRLLVERMREVADAIEAQL